jgi:isopenicillin-N epimerase
VLEAQSAWRAEMERQPVDFLDRRIEGLLADARARVGPFLRADPEGLVFVPNATTAVSTVLRGIGLAEGDEVVMTDHAYPAVLNAVGTTCAAVGARRVIVPVPLPLPGPGAIVEGIAAGITARARLVIVDHVTSPTAAILPVEPVVAACRARGVPVLVDAAHVPGMLDVDVDGLGADFWTGNFHKWMCAPKGAGALVVAPAWRDRLRPLVTSHEHLRSFHARFDWTGTDDPTAVLSVPAAIDFLDGLGLERLRAHNHQLALYGREAVAHALGADRLVPDDATGSMSLVPLPEGVATTRDGAHALKARLYDAERIEVPFGPWNGRCYVRLSAQVYNHPAEYDRLARALSRALG